MAQSYQFCLSLDSTIIVSSGVYAVLVHKNTAAKTSSFKISTTHFLGSTHNWKTRLLHVPFIFRCIGLAAFIIALARPQQKFTEQVADGEGIDIVLCLDISGSMTEKTFYLIDSKLVKKWLPILYNNAKAIELE